MMSVHFRAVVVGLFFISSALTSSVFAETVTVKYREGVVDLAPFQCETITRSSFINRLCYDKKEQYVIVRLKSTYYHYCEVPAGIVDDWRKADSMGSYYNAHVKGQFDCRIFRVPSYVKKAE